MGQKIEETVEVPLFKSSEEFQVPQVQVPETSSSASTYSTLSSFFAPTPAVTGSIGSISSTLSSTRSQFQETKSPMSLSLSALSTSSTLSSSIAPTPAATGSIGSISSTLSSTRSTAPVSDFLVWTTPSTGIPKAARNEL